MIALLEARASGLWSRKHIANNVLAGVGVGVVALPLAMAFAIASGARPEQGLYTAIVACLLTSLVRRLRADNLSSTPALALKRSQAIETASKTWIRIGKDCRSTAR
jgi:MFS superfamily sulfate permease-like transporter